MRMVFEHTGHVKQVADAFRRDLLGETMDMDVDEEISGRAGGRKRLDGRLAEEIDDDDELDELEDE